MSVRGDLDDIDLASILQMLCADNKRAAIHLNRHAEEGSVFVNRGKILHAETSELTGEEALYDLLTWEDGAFYISTSFEITQESVGSSIGHLLLEGARRRDEKTLRLAPDRAPITLDETTEIDLLELLTDLENKVSRLSTSKIRKHPVQTFKILENVTNAVIEFVIPLSHEDRFFETLCADLALVGKEHPQMHLVYVDDHRVSLDRLTTLYRDRLDDPKGCQLLLRQAKLGILCLLEIYFGKLLSCLPSTTAAESWSISYRVFLRELASSLEAARVHS